MSQAILDCLYMNWGLHFLLLGISLSHNIERNLKRALVAAKTTTFVDFVHHLV